MPDGRVEREDVAATIEAIERQRHALGDAVTDLALAPLRDQLAAADLPASGSDQKLRQTSILFVDIVGSTAIANRLDPEDVDELMDGILQRLTAAVQLHRGRVVNYTGDGFLAAFGADEAHEDDPELAVRAGLAILDGTRAMAADVLARFRVDGLDVRVGIDTGPVLLGGSVEGERNIRGNAVNVAARMEQSAPIGGLRISHETYRLVRGVFEVTEEPPISVKGIPNSGAHLRGPRRQAAGVPRPDARDRRAGDRDGRSGHGAGLPATVVRHAVHGAVVTGRHGGRRAGPGQEPVAVRVRELVRRAAKSVRDLQGSSSATHPPAAVRTHARPVRLASADCRQRHGGGGSQAFRGPVSEHCSPRATRHRSTSSATCSDSTSATASTSKASRRILDRSTFGPRRQQPTCSSAWRPPTRSSCIVEDLHWADDETLDFLIYLARTHPDLPMMIVGTTRPLLFERRPSWIDDTAPNERIDLFPLDQTQATVLADALLRKLDDPRSAIRRTLTERGDGNPFFMEEIVKMLLDEGVLVPTDRDVWIAVPERLDSQHVPSTLVGVLQARHDALPVEERVALQQASVIGFVFWDRAVAALDNGSPRSLGPLARRGFVKPQPGSSIADAEEFTFEHHLLQQFTYDSVLKRQRCEYHAWLRRGWPHSLRNVARSSMARRASTTS